jgi:hypothetical protein
VSSSPLSALLSHIALSVLTLGNISQVVIEQHPWVALGHMFSPFATLALPAAFFIFSLVFAVQRWMFARHGEYHTPRL